jgi:hypothetical protein
MPFPRLYRRTQVVPVSLGTARTDPAYEDSLVEQAIATREAARQQNELEAQRLETIQRRASQYAQAQAQAAERQAQAERQAAQAQAEVERAARGAERGVEADAFVLDNKFDVVEKIIADLHTKYPVLALEKYVDVPVKNLRNILQQDDIPEEAISTEVQARYNIIAIRNGLKQYRKNLNRTRTQSSTPDKDELQTVIISDDKTRQAFYTLYEKYKLVRTEQREDIEEIPEEFLCPLTSDFMVSPVYEKFVPYRRTYEKTNILKSIIADFTKKQQPKDPYSREPIYADLLTSNTALLQRIDIFKRKMYKIINDYLAAQRIATGKPPWLHGPKPRTRYSLRVGGKLRKLRQSVKKRKYKQAKQTKQAKQRKQTKQSNRIHAKLSKKYKKQYTKRVH